jgi:hypothetical protein
VKAEAEIDAEEIGRLNEEIKNLERELAEAVELLQPYDLIWYTDQYEERKKRIDAFLARHRRDDK